MVESASAPPRVKVGRRNFLIDRTFQLKYTLYMVVGGAAISLLFGAMMYQAHVEGTQILEDSIRVLRLDLSDPVREVVRAQDSTLLWLVMAISVIMAVALGLFGVLITHRVAGPIYVFSHYMNVLGEGRYPLLRPLRKKDELKAFYETFHGAVASMRERDKTRGLELKGAVAAIEAAMGKAPDTAAGLKPAAETLRALADRMLDAAATEEPATPGQKAEAADKSA